MSDFGMHVPPTEEELAEWDIETQQNQPGLWFRASAGATLIAEVRRLRAELARLGEEPVVTFLPGAVATLEEGAKAERARVAEAERLLCEWMTTDPIDETRAFLAARDTAKHTVICGNCEREWDADKHAGDAPCDFCGMDPKLSGEDHVIRTGDAAKEGR